MTKVINLYSGPGAGKSTTAALLFARMKQMGLEVELATEYAKDVVWWGAHNKFKNQIYIFAKQHSRIHRLLGKVDYVVTDSPILLSVLYDIEGNKQLEDLIVSEHNKMDTLDVFLNRIHDYKENGRMQTEDEAKEIDQRILNMFAHYGQDHFDVDAGEDAVDVIINELGLGDSIYVHKLTRE